MNANRYYDEWNKLINILTVLSIIIYIYSGKINEEIQAVFDLIIFILFLVDYIISIKISKNTKKYIFSLLGMIDLISIFLWGPAKMLRIFKFISKNDFLSPFIYAYRENSVIIKPLLGILLVVLILGGTFIFYVENSAGNYKYE